MPSHVIRSFSYDRDLELRTVTFVSGRRYRYDVPAELADEMRGAFAETCSSPQDPRRLAGDGDRCAEPR